MGVAHLSSADLGMVGAVAQPHARPADNETALAAIEAD
jgi:hypothetical protein